MSNATTVTTHPPLNFQFRRLAPTDGMALHRLVRACPPLDQNSSYCNLLQCSHFGATSIAALCEDELLGSITGYLIPDRQDTLFIWQAAVHTRARGQGLARTMLRKLLAQVSPLGVRYIETSITSDNTASWRLFTGFATEFKSPLNSSIMFDKALHFQGMHDTENLVCIGPIEPLTNIHIKE